MVSRYLSDKTWGFKGLVLSIFDNKKIYEKLDNDSLKPIKDFYIELYNNTKANKCTSSKEYDTLLSMETICKNSNELFGDIEKIHKILKNKNIQKNYRQIFDLMVILLKNEEKKSIEQITIPAHRMISRWTQNDKHKIVSLFLKSQFGNSISTEVISDLFDKFSLSYTSDEVNIIIEEGIEKQELEEFENNLGSTPRSMLNGFDSLNGLQFEDYLKELFIKLEYKATRTKSSGDQGADLILEKNGQKIVVQAKKYSGLVTNKAVQEVVASKAHYQANKAMVVTTGQFTKSAFDLANSNEVELWDKEKLDIVISEINQNNSKQAGQPVIIGKKTMPLSCPVCLSNIEFLLEELPRKGECKELSCPECSATLAMKMRDQDYSCQGCGKMFDNLMDKFEHHNSCLAVKEKLVTCQGCKTEGLLDNTELSELKKNGLIYSTCNMCGFKTKITNNM